MIKIVSVIVFFFLFPLKLDAKKLYKYQDKQGIWYFSDRKPSTPEKVTVKQLKAGTKRYFWLEKTGDKQNPEYFVINNYNGPIELEVKLVKKKNVKSIPQLPNRFVIQPGKSKVLFTMSAISKYKSWSYSLQYQHTIGDPRAIHDGQIIYAPPFAKNIKFRISQAFGGEYSHTDKQNKYAVDLAMPENTPLHAAREGVVIEVNNDFYENGMNMTYKNQANSIRILHDDGSMAVYAHLALEQAQVYPGLKVYTGQLIGYSGNTGYSSGPHLHFAVQVNKGMSLESVPFKFVDGNNVAIEPKFGEWLTH